MPRFSMVSVMGVPQPHLQGADGCCRVTRSPPGLQLRIGKSGFEGMQIKSEEKADGRRERPAGWSVEVDPVGRRGPPQVKLTTARDGGGHTRDASAVLDAWCQTLAGSVWLCPTNQPA
jgi:hypothetical protein